MSSTQGNDGWIAAVLAIISTIVVVTCIWVVAAQRDNSWTQAHNMCHTIQVQAKTLADHHLPWTQTCIQNGQSNTIIDHRNVP